jgi:hypothetical protein
MKSIGPLFKWFGSKWSASRRGCYPEPIADVIVEPFAGSAGYSLNHYQKSVVIWEDDPNLIRLWRWIINHATSAKVLDIPVGLSVGVDIRQVGLSAGQALLLKHWQRTNNVGDCWTISPWGHLPGQWTMNTRARVAEQVYMVKHWKIRQPIEFIDEPNVTWFIDPPYQYNYSYRGDLAPFDYDALVSFEQTVHRTSLFICCEAIGKHGEIPNYFHFSDSHSQVTSRRKSFQSHHSRELLYIRESAAHIRVA